MEWIKKLNESIQIQVYGGKFKMGTKTIMHIETERIVIRKFKPDDWKDLQEIAISKENSPFAACDHASTTVFLNLEPRAL